MRCGWPRMNTAPSEMQGQVAQLPTVGRAVHIYEDLVGTDYDTGEPRVGTEGPYHGVITGFRNGMLTVAFIRPMRRDWDWLSFPMEPGDTGTRWEWPPRV